MSRAESGAATRAARDDAWAAAHAQGVQEALRAGRLEEAHILCLAYAADYARQAIDALDAGRHADARRMLGYIVAINELAPEHFRQLP